jgi:hypothetical protein
VHADSSFVPPLIYSLLGSSRDLAVGPVSIASLVMGSMLREAVSPDEQPILYLQLAFTATFFAGVFQASLGFLRLGFIVDFLSKATLTGFMAGAAIIVSLQQLKGLLGIVHFTAHMGFVDVMASVVKRHDEVIFLHSLDRFSPNPSVILYTSSTCLVSPAFNLFADDACSGSGRPSSWASPSSQSSSSPDKS